MARLPDIGGQGGASISPAGGVAGYAPKFNGAEGAYIQEAGREAQQASDIVAAANERHDNIVAEDAFNRLKQQSITLQYASDGGFSNVRGGNAGSPQFVSSYLDKLKDVAKEIGDGLSNDNQKQAYAQRAQIVGLQFRASLMAHQAVETEKFQNETDKNSILTQRMSVAADPTNEDTFKTARSIVSKAVARAAQRNGLPEEAIAPMVKAENDNLILAQVNALRTTDPVMALSLLQKKRLELSPERYLESEQHTFDSAAPVLAATLVSRGGVPGPLNPDAAPAPVQVSMTGQSFRTPRGVRNNNPLNIVQTPQPWEGEVPGGDSRFKSFQSPEAGIKAAGSLLLTYAEKYGLNTVGGIISRWAPATENDTGSYVAQVSQAMGVDPNAPLNLRDKGTMSKLLTAMIQRENGQQPYSAGQLDSAVMAAINGTQIDPGTAPAQPPVMSWADLTPAQALKVQTGDPIIDGLPDQQKLHVLQLARTQALQKNTGLREAMAQRLQDSHAMYLSNGQAPTAPSYQEVVTAFGQIEGPQRWAALQNARQTGQALQQVKTLPNASLDAMLLNKPEPGDGFADRMRNYEVLSRAIQSVQQARQKDPVAYALAAGNYQINPITDLSKPEALTAELVSRGKVANQIAVDYGTRPQLLTAAETKALGSVLSAAPVEAQKQYLGAIRSGVQDIGQFASVMQSLAPDQPLLAHAAMAQARGYQTQTTQSSFLSNIGLGDKTVVQRRDVADLILRGNAILNPPKSETGSNKSLLKMPADSALKTDFNDVVGNAFTGKEVSRETFYQAARAIYAAKSVEEGDFATSEANDKAYNSARWKQAIGLAVGGIANVNGSQVVMPWGMREDEFKNAVKQQLAAAGPNAAGLTPDELVSLPLQSRADGQYFVMRGTSYVTDQTGRPLVVSVSAPKQGPSFVGVVPPPNKTREVGFSGTGKVEGLK